MWATKHFAILISRATPSRWKIHTMFTRARAMREEQAARAAQEAREARAAQVARRTDVVLPFIRGHV